MVCFSLQLLQEIQKVNITVNNTHVYFDANGDPSLGYDIVYWSTAKSEQGADIETIGEYWPDGEIKIPRGLVVSRSRVMVAFHAGRILISPHRYRFLSCSCFYSLVKGYDCQLLQNVQPGTGVKAARQTVLH